MHCGEEGPASNIRISVEELGVERIDHGTRLLDDPELARRVVAERIPLTSCPSSNVGIGIVADLASHPFARQRELGALVTLNSDDPELFHQLDEEYGAVAAAFGYDLAAMEQLALDSIDGTWLDAADRADLGRRFRAEFARLRAARDLAPMAG
jgi:adenosine deaminase